MDESIKNRVVLKSCLTTINKLLKIFFHSPLPANSTIARTQQAVRAFVGTEPTPTTALVAEQKDLLLEFCRIHFPP